MSRFLYRLGGSAAAHAWRTILAWVLVAAAVMTAAAAFGGTTQDDYTVGDARAQAGIEQLRDHFPEMGGASAQVLVHDPAGGSVPETVLGEVYDELGGLAHVSTVTPPRMSADGDTALFTVLYDVPVTDPDLMGDMAPLEGAVAPAEEAGLDVALGGELPGTAAAPMDGRGELIGIVAALVILVLAFGSVVAAGLPLAVALRPGRGGRDFRGVEHVFERRRTLGPCPSSSPRPAGRARSGLPAPPAGSTPPSPGCWTSARRSSGPTRCCAGTT
jgi:RND superfamily putative drug exporter